VCFLKLRIPKSLEKKTKRGKRCGAKATALRGLGEELRREGQSGGVEVDWLDCDENIAKGSIALAKR
jgi:hypothetical protein